MLAVRAFPAAMLAEATHLNSFNFRISFSSDWKVPALPRKRGNFYSVQRGTPSSGEIITFWPAVCASMETLFDIEGGKRFSRCLGFQSAAVWNSLHYNFSAELKAVPRICSNTLRAVLTAFCTATKRKPVAA